MASVLWQPPSAGLREVSDGSCLGRMPCGELAVAREQTDSCPQFPPRENWNQKQGTGCILLKFRARGRMPQASEDCAPKDGQGGLDGLETHGSNQHLPVHLISTVANQLDDIVTAQLLPACERRDNAWDVAMQDDALIGAYVSHSPQPCASTHLQHRHSC